MREEEKRLENRVGSWPREDEGVGVDAMEGELLKDCWIVSFQEGVEPIKLDGVASDGSAANGVGEAGDGPGEKRLFNSVIGFSWLDVCRGSQDDRIDDKRNDNHNQMMPFT